MFEPSAIAAEFEQLATDSERDLNRLKGRPRESKEASNYDELLAATCVYAYLRGRHFLGTQQQLVNELQWMRDAGRPAVPASARDALAFECFRDGLLAGLIARFAD